MAAPTKEGLDYFSFDVDLLDNDDLDFLREQYGVVVNDVYIALLTLLYRKKGYYIPYETEAEKKDCVWYIYKRVRGGKHPVQQGLIPIVIEALVAQGLFDSTRFNQNDHCNKIITSERAQKTYYKATVERKFESFDIRPEYWLLSDEIMRKLSKTHPYYLFLHPESKSDEKPSKSDEKPSKSDEKPLKKSKVNITSNEVNIKYTQDEPTEFETQFNTFCEKWDVTVDNCPPLLAELDFNKLNKAYSESSKFLQVAPVARMITWIVKNAASIYAGKYRDRLQDSKYKTQSDKNSQMREILQNVFSRYKTEEDNGDDS